MNEIAFLQIVGFVLEGFQQLKYWFDIRIIIAYYRKFTLSLPASEFAMGDINYSDLRSYDWSVKFSGIVFSFARLPFNENGHPPNNTSSLK
jgi:hypothetical protein